MKRDLVSIVVVTYNSARTVIDTLESIKMQTYKPVELIISDDCSTDDTKKVCTSWIEENKNQFDSALFLETDKNTGVCGNINRGIAYSNGQWIKVLAADDYMTDDAVEQYVNFCNSNSCHLCVSDAFYIDEEGNGLERERETSIWSTYLDYMGKNLKTQIKQVVDDKLCPGPPIFFDREVWDSFGGYNEKYRFADEWEMQYHVVMNGFMILPFKKKLIYYRVSNKSLCHSLKDNRSNISQRDFAIDVVIPSLLKQFRLFKAWDVYIRRTTPYFIVKHSNSNYKYLLLLSPIFVLSRLLKKK